MQRAGEAAGQERRRGNTEKGRQVRGRRRRKKEKRQERATMHHNMPEIQRETEEDRQHMSITHMLR